MKYLIILTFLSLTLTSRAQSQPEMNVIYGEQHIFTITTPEGWVNDKELASEIGLVSFFYAKSDADKEIKSHMYAKGYDKNERNKDLKSFMNGDITNFKKKYPNLTFQEIEIGKSGDIIDAKMLSFSNLEDRFKEEVLYLETEFSVLVFVFSTFSESDYKKYRPIFDKLIASFNYRGSNPQTFLEWQKKQNEN